jgi:hypothetical protein
MRPRRDGCMIGAAHGRRASRVELFRPRKYSCRSVRHHSTKIASGRNHAALFFHRYPLPSRHIGPGRCGAAAPARSIHPSDESPGKHRSQYHRQTKSRLSSRPAPLPVTSMSTQESRSAPPRCSFSRPVRAESLRSAERMQRHSSLPNDQLSDLYRSRGGRRLSHSTHIGPEKPSR